MSHRSTTFTAQGEEQTRRLAETIAPLLPVPVVVGLDGPLGAGKTLFVRALAASLGIDPQSVVSPTFALCLSYEGRSRLHHLDVYRLADEDELIELGADELFDDQAITCVEWSQRVAESLPVDHIAIQIAPIDEQARDFTISARHPSRFGLIHEIDQQICGIS